MRRTLVYSLNAIAIVSMCITIDSEFGTPVALRLIIPILIIASTNLASSILVLFPNKEGDREKLRDEKNEAGQGDGFVVPSGETDNPET